MGPVGSFAALLFAEAGLRVVAFERDAEVYRLPRAVMMDGEILRAFQRIGRAEEVSAMLRPNVGERAGFANSRREWLFGAVADEMGPNGWPSASAFHQPELEAHLRRSALQHAAVTGHVPAVVTGFEQSLDRVEIRATTDDGPITAQARYLVACDGAGSGTRRTLGIGWQSLGYDRDWLVVDVTVEPGHTLGNDTLQVCDPDRLVTHVVLKEPYRRWEFELLEGETREAMLEPAKILELIEPWTPSDSVQIVRSAVYQFHAAVAEQWRSGRIFLAGDAAHQTPPFLGQGMNAGMRDVVNLAWKLSLVLRGEADPLLLETYEAERAAHATDLVEWAVAFGRLMEHLAEVEAAERAGRPVPPEPVEQRSSGYGQGRAAPPLRAGAVATEQVSDSSSTGYLVRQPLLRDAHGHEVRLDDLLGSGFALVVRARDRWPIEGVSARLIGELGVAVVSLDGFEVARGRLDSSIDRGDALIVRPDRYVFGTAADQASLARLLLELRDAVHGSGDEPPPSR